jgi:hypothetical protein
MDNEPHDSGSDHAHGVPSFLSVDHAIELREPVRVEKDFLGDLEADFVLRAIGAVLVPRPRRSAWA